MSTKNFSEYIKSAYQASCVRLIESKFPDYLMKRIKEKDEILLKIHVVTCLMNTILVLGQNEIQSLRKRERPKDESSSSDSAPVSKKQKMFLDDLMSEAPSTSIQARIHLDRPTTPDYPRTPSPSYLPHSPIYQAKSPTYNEDMPFTFEDVEMEDYLDYEPEMTDIPKNMDGDLRFVCPILLGQTSQVVVDMALTHGFNIPNGFPIFSVDILDKETKKLIFLRRCGLDEVVGSLFEEYQMEKEYIGVVELIRDDQKIQLHNCTGLNEKSANNMLAIRHKEMIRIYGVKGLENEMPPDELISDYIKVMRSQWENPIFEEMNKEWIPECPDFDKMNVPQSLPAVNLEVIINNLENVFETRKDKPQACWSGKILPYSVVDPVISCKEDDISIMRALMDTLGTPVDVVNLGSRETDATTLLENLMLIKDMIMDDSFNNFRTVAVSSGYHQTFVHNDHLHKVLNETKLTNLLKNVGYNVKGKKGEKGDFKQPEYKTKEKKSYPYWMINLFKKELEPADHPIKESLMFSETEPSHKIDTASVEACKQIYHCYKETNCASTVSRYMGVSSRLSGAYMIDISKENKAQSNLVTMPIYHLAQQGIDEYRVISGVILRGPHHVRDATDKINYIHIERVKEGNDQKMYKKGILITDNRGHRWYIAKNAMPKIFPSYGAFMHDLLFLPANFIGDMIIKTDLTDLVEKAKRCVSENEDFIKHRLVELMFMGMTGSSEEEGYFSGYRMLYMLLLELSRGKYTSLVNVPGFFEAINECVISGCYVLFTHGNLLHTLKYIKENCNISVNGFNLKP